MKKRVLAAITAIAALVAAQAAQAEWLTASQIRTAVSGKTCVTGNGNRITFGSQYTVRDHAGPTYSGPYSIHDGYIAVNFTKASGAASTWRPRTKTFGISRRNGGGLFIGTVPMKC